MSLKISPLDSERDVAFDSFVAGEEASPGPTPVPPSEAPLESFDDPTTADEPTQHIANPFAPVEAPPTVAPETIPGPPPVRPAPWAAAPPPLPPPPGVDPHVELRRTIDRDPDALGPRLRLGAALAQSAGTAAEAIALLSSVLEREPQHPLAHGSLALAHAQLGETSEAERHLTRALRLGHVDPELERRVRGVNANSAAPT
jgi:hypothetical protein